MLKKKYSLFLSLILLFAITFVGAVKPITSVQTATGYSIEPTEKSAIKTNQNHEFGVHVFNISNGVPITSGITCYMHLYHGGGMHLYTGETETTSNIFDYSFNISGGNFSDRGEYQAKFQCNSSAFGGSSQLFFYVNDYGEELDTAHSIKFNSTMFFLLILFISALIGLFKVEQYIGKFTLYWVCHIIFILGTFSVWQFNQGYTMHYLGLASIWKIMFYVSTMAVFPMLLLSIAWVVYIHLFNEHFQKLVDKGVDTEEAFKMTTKKKKGWFHGQ